MDDKRRRRRLARLYSFAKYLGGAASAPSTLVRAVPLSGVGPWGRPVDSLFYCYLISEARLRYLYSPYSSYLILLKVYFINKLI